MKDMHKSNGEILDNGYKIIHKTSSVVLAFKKRRMDIEYVTWKFAFNGGTVHGNYFTNLESAVKDYKERVVILERIDSDYAEFLKCLELHKEEIKTKNTDVIIEVNGEKKELSLNLDEKPLYTHICEIAQMEKGSIQVWIKGSKNEKPLITVNYSELFDRVY